MAKTKIAKKVKDNVEKVVKDMHVPSEVAGVASIATPDFMVSDSAAGAAAAPAEEKKVVERKLRIRGKKYINARARIDRTKIYSIDEAITLAKKTHFAKFPGSLEVNLVLREEGMNVDVVFPHATGRTVSVAIATDELLKDIEKGVITFTMLIAHPSMMPKLSKLARILGPKGLMPNPKNNTLTQDPEKRKKELEGGAVTVKSEKKAPLVHVVIGKLTQPEGELAANLRALMKAFPAGKVVKCTIAPTMGPGIKVRVE